jgi:hypothetical protein
MPTCNILCVDLRDSSASIPECLIPGYQWSPYPERVLFIQLLSPLLEVLLALGRWEVVRYDGTLWIR